MKILHVVRQFYPAKGGLEDHVLNLATYQLQSSNEITIFTLDKNFQSNQKLKKIDTHNGINIHRFSFIGFRRYPICFLPFKELIKFDVIHIHAVDFFLDYISLLKRLGILKQKILITSHGLFFHTRFLYLLKKLYFYTFTRISLKKIDQIISVSNQDQILLKKINVKSILIPNGVVFQKFGFINQIKNECNNYLFIGRPASQKNLSKLVEFFCRLKIDKISLTIIVPHINPLVTELSKLIKKYDCKSINIHVNISDNQILDIIKNSKYVISASKYEGFGIAIIELMSYGLIPILNAEVPSFKEFATQSKSGFLFNDEFKDFQKTIISSLNSKNLNEMSVNSINYSQSYSWKAISSQILSVYKLITKNVK